jgi:hypothetical protein
VYLLIFCFLLERICIFGTERRLSPSLNSCTNAVPDEGDSGGGLLVHYACELGVERGIIGAVTGASMGMIAAQRLID